MKHLALAALVLLNAYFCALGVADAADTGAASAPAQGGRPGSPPPEAIAACQGKTAGTSVSFTGRRGETMTGTCEAFDGTLAARPSFAPGGHPPQGK